MERQEHDGEHQRDKKVNYPVDQDRAEQAVGRQVRHHVQQSDLEHAEPAGHMGNVAGDDRQHVDADERQVGDMGALGQQQVEHGGGQEEVARGQRQLGQGEGQARQIEGPVAQMNWPAPHQSQQKIAGDGGDQRRAEASGQPNRQGQLGKPRGRLEQQGQADHEAGADREGDAADRGYHGDLDRREPGPGVDSEARRAAGQQRDADVVADREADEGGERHGRVGQGVLDVAHRERVVAGQDHVAAGGQQQGNEHGGERHRLQLGQDIGQAGLGELPVQRPKREPKDRDGEGGPDPVPLHAPC